MDIISWLYSLPNSGAWPEFADDSEVGQRFITFQLFADHDDLQQKLGSKRLIFIRAEKSDGMQEELPLICFSICVEGFDPGHNTSITLWVSNPLPLSSNTFIFLLLQLLNEIISHSTKPIFNHTTAPSIGSNFETVLFQALHQYPFEQLSKFMNFIILGHLFWKCVFDVLAEVGLFYFQLLSSNLNYLHDIQPLMITLLTSLGAECELYLMRSFGYMLAKLWILKEINPSELDAFPNSSPSSLSFSYAMDSHGLLLLKGYAPVQSMTRASFNGEQLPIYDAKESLLRYALGHQLLEAVVQYEYTISYTEHCIQVCIRLDNIRIHVTRLGFNRYDDEKKGEDEFLDERHFPSRVRVFLGPVSGPGNYLSGLSLGRSTNNNGERKVEVQKVVKGSFGDVKSPEVKVISKSKTRARMQNWKMGQDAEGNVAVFEAILCDGMDGVEVARWQPSRDGHNGAKGDMRRRHSGAFRPFNKSGGLVFAGDEYGEQVKWRMGKEMAGKVLKWKLGGKVWLSYFPKEFKTNYFETRYIEWSEDLDMIVPNE